MQQIKELNKALKTVQDLSNKSIEAVVSQINGLPEEHREKYRQLLKRAKSGDLTVEQLIKEVNNG